MTTGRPPRFEGPARRRAIVQLDRTVELFGQAGYAPDRRPDPLDARVRSSEGRLLQLRMARDGRIFGGTYALEISSAKAVLPPTRGVSARGRGVVKLAGISFHAKRGDEAGRQLAERLGADERLVAALSAVHFERIRIEPDGRPVIRHLGGSLVWVAFPPLVKAIPLVPDQVRATLVALDAFAAAGS